MLSVPHQEPSLHAEDLRVLAVDDNPALLRGLERTLGAMCDLHTAIDGVDALEKIAEVGSFRVVLTDQRMPRMRGDQLVRRLKEESPHTSCVIMTGNAKDDAVRDIMKEEGMVFRLLTKPSETGEIYDALVQADRAARNAESLALANFQV